MCHSSLASISDDYDPRLRQLSTHPRYRFQVSAAGVSATCSRRSLHTAQNSTGSDGRHRRKPYKSAGLVYTSASHFCIEMRNVCGTQGACPAEAAQITHDALSTTSAFPDENANLSYPVGRGDADNTLQRATMINRSGTASRKCSSRHVLGHNRANRPQPEHENLPEHSICTGRCSDLVRPLPIDREFSEIALDTGL